MRAPLLRVVAAVLLVLSLLAVAFPRLTTTTASAKTWQANPAPYQQLKVPISPMAVAGLQRQQTGPTHTAPPNGGSGNDDQPNPLFGKPHKPVGVASAPYRVGPSGFSPAGPQGGTNTPPTGSIVFNNDASAVEQNETSVTVRQTASTAAGATTQVVGGVNDFRGFDYIPGFCGLTPGTFCYPARNCVSTSGFSVSLNGGKSLSKSSCLPWVNKTFEPFGDPALDRDTAGNVYYGSLGFDQTAGSGQNGITLHRSTPALFDPTNPCQNVVGTGGADNTNPCWTGRVVSIGNTSTNPTTGKCDLGFCTFADKDWVAVDRYSPTRFRGDVYVTWNSFTVAGEKSGESHMLLARCHPDAEDPTGFAYCTTPINVAKPGDDFTGGGSYLTVTADGHVLVAYINFGTATTLYPIDYRIAVVAPGGQTVQGYINQAHLTPDGNSTTTPCVPNRSPSDSFEANAPCEPNMSIDAAAGVTFRLPEFYHIDVDRTASATQNRVYTTFELCTLPQYYPQMDQNNNIIYPGNCPKSDVFVATTQVTFARGTFTSTPTTYKNLTGSAPGQEFFPSVSVDDGTGRAVVTYNSTQDDPFQNMDSVYAQESTNGGVSFGPLSGTTGGRITDRPYQIAKDPALYFGQGATFCAAVGDAGGCFGYWPQNGDYLQSVAFFGHLYTHYTGTYVQKGFLPDPAIDAFTLTDAAYPMNQDDNYLASNTL